MVLHLAGLEVKGRDWEHWQVFEVVTAVCKQRSVILLDFRFLEYSASGENCKSV